MLPTSTAIMCLAPLDFIISAGKLLVYPPSNKRWPSRGSHNGGKYPKHLCYVHINIVNNKYMCFGVST